MNFKCQECSSKEDNFLGKRGIPISLCDDEEEEININCQDNSEVGGEEDIEVNIKKPSDIIIPDDELSSRVSSASLPISFNKDSSLAENHRNVVSPKSSSAVHSFEPKVINTEECSEKVDTSNKLEHNVECPLQEKDSNQSRLVQGELIDTKFQLLKDCGTQIPIP